jgi:hypothetical protein
MADTHMHRNRTTLVAVVYLVYFGLSISALVSLGQGHQRYALVTAVVLPVLHFTTSSIGLAMNDRRALTSSLAPLVLVGDWMQAAALGLAANSVNRSHLDDEATAAVFAHLLLILGQLICFAKSRDFLDSSKYDQDSGDLLA